MLNLHSDSCKGEANLLSISVFDLFNLPIFAIEKILTVIRMLITEIKIIKIFLKS